jgi:putative MFS transporter
VTATTDRAVGIPLTARIERLPLRALAPLLLGILGPGFFVNFYDSFDINVSFIQTCGQLQAGCTPQNASGWLGLPVLLSLVGYTLGALVIAPQSDRFGRRATLLVTMLITSLGALGTLLAGNYETFVLARLLTGIGIGADLAVVNTYIGEVAPSRSRARYASATFVMSTLGALTATWLGLLLTTEPAPWPSGLPVALAGGGFDSGWRWMYAIAVLLGIGGFLLRLRLPESPRWLLGKGRGGDADAIVSRVEARALRHGPLPEPVAGVDEVVGGKQAHRELFGNSLYRRRAALLLAIWFIGYITVYGFAAGFSVLLTGLGHPPAEAAMICAVGSLGFFTQGLVSARFSERLERRHWLPVAALVTVAGAAVVAAGGGSLTVAFIGAFLIFFGFNAWIPPTYALSAESFPTRARSTGFGLVDGIGHLGGGVGLLAIAPLIPHLNTLAALGLMSSFLIVAAVLAQFTPRTRNRPLEEVSP